MPDGMKGPISRRRRAGLEAPLFVSSVVWDGRVPERYRAAFAHRLRRPDGREVMARWYLEELYGPGRGFWIIEGEERGWTPEVLSREGWAHVEPLAGEAVLRALVDATHGYAHEDTSVPRTSVQTQLIERAWDAVVGKEIGNG